MIMEMMDIVSMGFWSCWFVGRLSRIKKIFEMVIFYIDFECMYSLFISLGSFLFC